MTENKWKKEAVVIDRFKSEEGFVESFVSSVHEGEGKSK